MLLHQFNFQSPYNKLLFCYINKRQKKIDPFKTFFVLQGKYKDRVLKEETFFASNGVNHIPIQQHFFDFIHDPEDFFTEFVCYSDLKYDKYFTANLFYSKYSRNLSNLIQTHSFNFFKLAKVLDNLKLKSRSRSVYTRIRFLSKKTFSYFSIITY